MDNALLDIIEEIIEILEDDNYDAYVYNNNKFTFIDKYNNIDFEAKLSNNNYYFKDNISGISFMKTKKYIDDNTTMQQMLIQQEQENCYFAYLERNGYVSLVRVARIEGTDSLICNNMNVIGQPWDDISKYADECFETIDHLDDIEAIMFVPEEDNDITFTADMEDKEIKRKFGITDEEIDEEYAEDSVDDYEEDDYEYETNQIEENSESGLSDMFESNSIQDYETYIENKEQCEANGEKYDQNNDNLPMGGYSEAIEEYYSNYKLFVNKHEVDGQAKCRIIADCEAAVDEKAYQSGLFDAAVIELSAVLQALQKQKTSEKNNDIER